MKRLFFFTLLVLLSLSGNAQFKISNNCIQDLETIEKYSKENGVDEWLTLKYPVYTWGGINYVSLIAKVNADFNVAQTEDMGAIVGSRIKNIVTIKYPIEAIGQLHLLQGVELLKVADKVKPFLDKVRYDTKVDSVHQGINLPEAYTGKDVIIGVQDWGFDYSHPMFYDTLLQNSRILAAWDQFKTSGPAPAGFTYGTEFDTPAELAAAVADTAGVYSFHTHGSHVAGIAGGSGAGLEYRGMAFEAQFLFASFLVDEGAVLDSWQWMYEKAQAAGKPLVVNMSWGLYNVGDLDGSSPVSEALDAYSDLGVLFVTSGGNNGNVNFHIKKDYNQDTIRTNIIFYNGSANGLWGQSIHAWGEVGQNFSAGLSVLDGATPVIESPWYHTQLTTAYLDTFLVPVIGDTIWYNLSMDEVYPSNSRPQMRLRVKIPPSGYSVILKSEANSGTVHYWNLTELTTDVGNWGMNFVQGTTSNISGDNLYGIGTPACTETAITVAAHSSTYETTSGNITGGQRANFSSIGPKINGDMKPDISAPGVGVTSSISSVTDASYSQIDVVNFNGTDYPFAKFSGTSMSSPAVTGIAALMLDANPYLNPMQVKDIILASAREDSYTGTLPAGGDPEWGHGKINAYVAVILAVNTVGLNEINKPLEWSIYPNPASHVIIIDGIVSENYSVQIIDLNGQLITDIDNEKQLDVSQLAKGTYILRIIQNGQVEQQKFVVQ